MQEPSKSTKYQKSNLNCNDLNNFFFQIIVLKDVSARHFEILLKYMYMGCVTCEKSDFAHIIQAANSLRIRYRHVQLLHNVTNPLKHVLFRGLAHETEMEVDNSRPRLDRPIRDACDDNDDDQEENNGGGGVRKTLVVNPFADQQQQQQQQRQNHSNNSNSNHNNGNQRSHQPPSTQQLKHLQQMHQMQQVLDFYTFYKAFFCIWKILL